MPRESWVPKDRIAWLHDRYPAYLKTKRNTRTVFMDSLFREYIARWPHDEPSTEFLEEFRMKPNPLINAKQQKARQPSADTNTTSDGTDMVRCSDEETRQRALARLDELLLKRLKEWFRNHGRVTSHGDKALAGNSTSGTTNVASKVLSLGMMKTTQSWQAYFSKYRNKLQPLVDQDWQSYRASLSKSEQASTHWISFFQKWCKDRLAGEEESVKAEVEEYRLTYNEFEDPSETHDEKLRRYQQAQNKIYRTIDAAGESLLLQSAWSSLIMVGGPEIKAGGGQKIIVSCAGEVEGKNFVEWLGDVRYGKLQKWFADFLSEKYEDSIASGSWVCKTEGNLTTSGSGHTGSSSENATGLDDEHSESEDTESNSDDNDPRDCDSNSTKKVADYLAPLEQREAYAREKEASTAFTKQLLDQMRQELHEGLAEVGKRPPILGVKAAKPKSVLKHTRKVSSKQDELKTATRHSARLQENNKDTEKVSHDSFSSEVVSGEKSEGTKDPDATETSRAELPAPAISVTDSTSLTTDIAAEAKKQDGNEEETTANAEHAASVGPDIANHTPPIDMTTLSHNLESTSNENKSDELRICLNNQDGSATPSTQRATPDVADVAITNPLLNSTDAPKVPDNATLETETPSAASIVVQTPLAPQDIDMDDGAGADSAAPAAPMDPATSTTAVREPATEGATAADADTEVTIDVSSLQVPHKDMNGAWPVLIAASTDVRWIRCLRAFVDFECSKPPNGKLNVSARPTEVTSWVRDKKKHLVPEIKAGKYGKDWLAWWQSLQPPSRCDDSGVPHLRHSIPSDEWSKTLLKGGTAGIYTVVVALAWWVKTCPDDPELWACVDDTTWVLAQLLTAHQAVKKRGAVSEDAEGSSVSKKRRLR
ncbi:hypothetical protein CVT24_010771 [Panaeolus cyanescens]|uniref:Uncharacterized protein n=1 Tax=Panaeolus cyanescens TaxID=181874 RepID=A0A409YYM1_9AGAR|nr:hypothetical protein CVT24_010771 [Panaeolus cyanescens]